MAFSLNIQSVAAYIGAAVAFLAVILLLLRFFPKTFDPNRAEREAEIDAVNAARRADYEQQSAARREIIDGIKARREARKAGRDASPVVDLPDDHIRPLD